MHATRFLAALALLSLVGCSAAAPTGTPPPVPTPTQAPVATPPPSGSASQPPSGAVFALRTMPQPGGPNEICAGVGLDAVLHGDPADPKVAWLTSKIGGPRLEIVWPFGFTARFTPDLEILDADGNVVIREGGAVTGTCDNLPDGAVYIIPPFR